jgi:hypothetical protein
MSEDTNVEDYEIFYYFDSQGRKYYTPSEIYASYRAKHYGTNKVYIEKN